MAVENKRMQQRYGTYADFMGNKDKLLPNEFASVTSDDPKGTRGKGLYFSFAPTDIQRLVTEEELTAKMAEETDVATLEEIKAYIG